LRANSTHISILTIIIVIIIIIIIIISAIAKQTVNVTHGVADQEENSVQNGTNMESTAHCL
jgi:uncharacterized protein YpmB